MKKVSVIKELQQQLSEAQAELKKIDKLKDSFLANMSHEIRTPMNAIVGAAELLRDDSITEEERNEFIRVLTKSSNDLLYLFDKMLELSQLESDTLDYIESEVKVHELLSELHSIFEYKIGEVNKNITLGFTEDLEENRIFTDHAKLTNILTYLLDNAVKFTNSGKIDFGCVVQNKNTIIFFVKDTGVGISKTKQDKIFKKFTQADNSYTRSQSGAGLGLSISKEIVELLGGKLYLDSEEGTGSMFYFTLPFKFSESDTILKDKIEALLKQKGNTNFLSNIRKDII